MELIIVSISEGLLWGVMALGIFISFRILRLADLTIEGSFPLGAAIASILITNGFHPISATVIALIGGALGGLITGLLMTKFRIPPLLAGILTMTGLYSINLRIMGRSNISLLNHPRVTQLLNDIFPLPILTNVIIVASLIILIIITLLYLLFKTDLGQALIATGDNERMAKAMGINTSSMKVLGLMAANSLVALSGALIAQNNGYADINMGIGTIVIGLASVMIAEVVFNHVTFGVRLTSLAIGSIFYRLIISSALSLGLQPNDLKLISAVLLALVISIPSFYDDYINKLNFKREGNANV